MLLGEILAIPPSEIAFRYGVRGKPYLGFDTELQFNVSHSQDWAMMAFARGSSVGVDLEMIDRSLNEEAIASQLFNTGDFATWICLPEAHRREVLLSLWVAKEAVLKSVGVGIAASLKKLVLPIPLPNVGCLVTLDRLMFDVAVERIGLYESERNLSKEWRLQLITELPFAMAAVCFEQPLELRKICYWDDVFVPK